MEAAYLESEFMDFYANCLRYAVKPTLSIIEKKSTGVTLKSILDKVQGLQVIDVNRGDLSASQGFKNKTARFLACQPYVAKKQVSLPRYGKHTHMCLEHMKKITASQSHRFDDIADTLSDAIRAALIDQIITKSLIQPVDPNKAAQVMHKLHSLVRAKNQRSRS